MKHRIPLMLMLIILALAVAAAGAEDPGAAEGLIIDTAELTDEPVFIDWVQDDIPMQLIALRDIEGAVRLALNTCQSCNGSPWAWFEYPGNGVLVCQNCGQQVPISLVGAADAWGCAPIPVIGTEEVDGYITVPGDVLADAAPLFLNWRKTGQ